MSKDLQTELNERWTCFNDQCEKGSRCVPCRLNQEKVFIELGKLSGKVLQDNPKYIMPTEEFKLAGDNIMAILNQAVIQGKIEELHGLQEDHETGAFYSRIIKDRLAELKQALEDNNVSK